MAIQFEDEITLLDDQGTIGVRTLPTGLVQLRTDSYAYGEVFFDLSHDEVTWLEEALAKGGCVSSAPWSL